LDGQLTASQCLAIQPNAHGIAPLTVDAHERHTLDHREAIDQVPLDVVVQLEDRALGARHIDDHHRIAVGIDLADLRRIDLVGQIALHP
jgi:hypothetical protein